MEWLYPTPCLRACLRAVRCISCTGYPGDDSGMKTIALLLLAFLLLAVSPFVYYMGISFSQGYDVENALRYYFADRQTGTTIGEDKVPVVSLEVTWAGDVENHRLLEASGLAQSSISPGILFSINDSGNDPELFALDSRGNDLGFWKVDTEKNVDWEDVASFMFRDEPYLLIADTGDNFHWRPTVEFIIIREPEPESLAMDAILPVEWKIEVEYPNGYRDCEAVAVDEASETIFFISKRVVPAEVYRVPLKPSTLQVKATRMALLNTIPQPSEQDKWEDPKYGLNRSQPTAFDIRGNKAVVFTYKDAYLFKRGWRDNWIDAFSKVPARILLPPVYAQEAGLITRSEKFLFVTSEREAGTNRIGLYRVKL